MGFRHVPQRGFPGPSEIPRLRHPRVSIHPKTKRIMSINHSVPHPKIFQIIQKVVTVARKGLHHKEAHLLAPAFLKGQMPVSLALATRISKIIIQEWIFHQEKWEQRMLGPVAQQAAQLVALQQDQQEMWLVLPLELELELALVRQQAAPQVVLRPVVQQQELQ